jgi:hypothetical protein
MKTIDLMDGVRGRLADSLPPYLGVLSAGIKMFRQRAELTKTTIDPLGDWCADEALSLVRERPARVFEAYVCLEVAAARDHHAFGASFRGYRDHVMRAVLGAARDSGLMANVAETTVGGRWVGRDRSRVRAELRRHELRVHFDDGRTIVLDRDLGMDEGCDA